MIKHMTHVFQIMKARPGNGSSNEQSEKVVNKTSLNADLLAQEFGVSEALMAKFLDRFAPSHVVANRFAAEADTMLFIHIPKTAGVSVGRSLREAFDTFRGVEWNNIAQSFRQETRAATYAQTSEAKRQVIMGHFGWPEMQIWRNNEMPMKCATIFRDPIARTISNYNYNCSSRHPANQNFKNRFPTLEAYVRQIPLDAQLTQSIGLINSFENALQKLISYYSFLGVTERLATSLNHLGRSHGLPTLNEYRENIGKTASDSDISPKLRKIIENRSHNDIKIHRLIMRVYDV